MGVGLYDMSMYVYVCLCVCMYGYAHHGCTCAIANMPTVELPEEQDTLDQRKSMQRVHRRCRRTVRLVYAIQSVGMESDTKIYHREICH